MKGTKSEGGVYGKDLSPPEGVFLEKLDEIILPYNKVFCTECLGTCSQHFFFFFLLLFLIVISPIAVSISFC